MNRPILSLDPGSRRIQQPDYLAHKSADREPTENNLFGVLTMETMTRQHARWVDFYNLVHAYVVDHGCAHGTTGSERALRAMGFTDDEIVASLENLTLEGGFCDCEILMNCADGPNGDDPEPRNPFRPEAFDVEQHAAFGRERTEALAQASSGIV